MPDLVADTEQQGLVDVAAVEPGAAATSSERRLRRIAVRTLRIAVIVIIAASITYSTVTLWPDVRQTLLHLAWQSVLLSLVAALFGYAANTMGWRAALQDLEFEAPFPTVARIYLIGGLAKYVPGGVWAYVLQMELGQRAGLPRARAFLASLVATGLSITAGLVVGTFGLRALFRSARSDTTGTVVLYVVAAVVPIALICAHPRVLTYLIQLFLRIVRRRPLEHQLSWPGVLKVMGWSAVAFVFFGFHLWLLANAQAAPGVRGVFVCIGAFALAMIAGIFVVVSPSGLGAREAVLTAALAAFVSPGAALGIALASRAIFTVADVLAAGGAAISTRHHLRKAAATAE